MIVNKLVPTELPVVSIEFTQREIEDFYSILMTSRQWPDGIKWTPFTRMILWIYSKGDKLEMPISKPITTDEATSGPKVLHFKGKLVDITDESRAQRADPSKSTPWLKFDFAQLNVIEANEPYTFPTFTIEVMEINIPKTNWEVMKKSIRDAGYSGPIDGIIGKNCEMKWDVALLSMRNQNEPGFADREGHCWQFKSIEGVENTSGQLLEWVISHADNQNNATFKGMYLSDASIRNMTSYAETTGLVMQDQFLTTLVAGGSLTVDDNGVYHKAG